MNNSSTLEWLANITISGYAGFFNKLFQYMPPQDKDIDMATVNSLCLLGAGGR